MEHALEQVAEPRVSEAALGLGRSRREHTHSVHARMPDPRKPQGRLPDARVALEHQSTRTPPHLPEEGTEGGDFLVSADDLGYLAATVTQAPRNAIPILSAWQCRA